MRVRLPLWGARRWVLPKQATKPWVLITKRQLTKSAACRGRASQVRQVRGSAGPPGGGSHGRGHPGAHLQTSDLSAEARCWDAGVCRSSPFYMAGMSSEVCGARSVSWGGRGWSLLLRASRRGEETERQTRPAPLQRPLPLRAWREQRSIPPASEPSERGTARRRQRVIP